MSEIKGFNYPTFNQDDVEILDKRTVFQGFFRINQYQMRHRLFAGGWSEVVTREMFERGHAVVVLPYDVNLDQLVLVEQIRLGAKVGAEDHLHSPWLLEAVAGMFGPDEDCEQVARREAEEEAGLTLGRLQPMLSYLSSPGGTTERIHLFLGELVAPVQTGIFGLPEEHEDIRVHLLSRSDAMQLLADGKIDNAATVIALQWLALHHAKICAAWE
ncbi:MAG: ADP-ribose diphosphatase [Gammaproteobacteria bacterium]|nr:ADP-ribose diphosphatase [Gammaproteobacteria bacterium]MBU2181007.1 ADP-ribose diphosphatase [Gammaproteobacteria bacterium]MBU2277874.1 ADP-ribose diphosphatase [Gammaproteobacteria bacterium]MBU2427297.1 ADP-ribose diphosphatase [Gammaproteobacteria bacterium]